MEKFHPHVVEPQPWYVPAQIEVPGYDVRDVGRAVEWATHSVARQGSEPGGIQPMAQVIQRPVVIQHVPLVFGGDGNLIGHAPAHDGGVVVVLDDKLGHLTDGVFSAAGHML